MKKTFFNAVLILFIAGVLAKILGAIYRIPLTWLLGAEGIGIYQLVYPVFSLLLVLSSLSMPTAISKMVADSLKFNLHKRAKKILKASLICFGSFGFLLGVVLSLLALPIANLQSNTQAVWCYIVLSPAIVFVSLISCFRGYFQGYNNMVPTAVSQIVEQAGKLLLGLLFSYLFLPFGIVFATFGALLGVAISELLALMVLCIIYLKSRTKKYNYSQNDLRIIVHNTRVKKFSHTSRQRLHLKYNERIFARLVKTAYPIILANLIFPLLSFIESLLIVPLLLSSGVEQVEATKLWGINSGVVNSLINLPLSLSLAVAISIVPAVASTKLSLVQEKFGQAVKISLLICMPIFVAFLLIGEQLLSLLYQSSLGGSEYVLIANSMLISSCFNLIFGSILQVQNSCMQAINKGKMTMLNMLIAGIIKLTLFIFLIKIPSINIWGSVISGVVFFATAFMLNFVYIRFKLKIRFNLKNIVPSFMGAILLALFIININLALEPSIIRLALQIVGGGLLYLFSILVFSDYKELSSIIKFKNKKIKINSVG